MTDPRWFGGEAFPTNITVELLPGEMDLLVPHQVGLLCESLVTHAALMSRLLHVSSGTVKHE